MPRRWFDRGLRFPALLCLLCPLFAGKTAAANGRFPAAGQVVFNPNDPQHVLVSATFGLIESRDGGQSFSWICEAVLGLSGTVDTSVAITEGGVMVVTNNSTGIMASTDRCSFAPTTAWASEILPDLTLSRSAPRELFAFTASVAGADQFDSSIQHSTDEGRTWQEVSSLPDSFVPVTIDVAPSNADRVYISARVGSQEDYVSVLFRSDDRGATFERVATVPGTEGLRVAYIAGVHPNNPDLLYLRVDHPEGTRLLRSDDGAASFEQVFAAQGALLGFAVSGTELAFGGPMDGVWTGDANGITFERRSDLGPLCLAYGADGLYACADAATDGFSLGRSIDSGQTFEPLLNLTDLCGSTACESDTQVGMACPTQWNELAPRIGTSCGVTEPSSGGSGQGGSTQGGSTQGGSSSGGSGGSGGGSCLMGRGNAERGALHVLGLLALISLRCSRRRDGRWARPTL